MAAPSWVAVSTPQTFATQNVTVNYPAGAVDDRVYIVIRNSQQSTAITHAAGVFSAYTGLNSSNNISLWQWKATGTAAGTAAFSAQLANTISDAVAIRLSGVLDVTLNLDQAATGRDTVGSVNSSALTLTNTTTDTRVIYVDFKNASSRVLSTAPTGMTLRTSTTDTAHVFDMTQAATGTTGSKQAVFATSSLHYDVLFSVKGIPATSAAFLGII